jgi:hypothetical protein
MVRASGPIGGRWGDIARLQCRVMEPLSANWSERKPGGVSAPWREVAARRLSNVTAMRSC